MVVDNTSEAEFVACSMCSKEVRSIMNIFNELQIYIEQLTIYVDNQSAIVQLNQLAFPSKLKHIDIKYHMVRQLIRENIINVSWIDTAK